MPDWTGNFDARLDVEAPLSDQKLAQVPARRGVVALFADDDKPIVLMTAADIRARVGARLREPAEKTARRSADLRQITRAVLWRLAGSHFETDLRFFNICRSIWPKTCATMLAWKPAWFVHVDPADRHPHFCATRKVFASPGRYFGPFATENSASRFLEVIQDGFDLCRDYRCLRQSPRAERCTYGQMGKCLSPCDGSISMEDYRAAVAKASDFAAGGRNDYRQELSGRMRAAAVNLQFELAGRIKTRLERLGELDRPEFEHAGPAERFQFILIQRSDKPRQAKTFLVDLGRITEMAPLDYPLRPEQVEGVLAQMNALAARPAVCGEEERWLIGLVARYLFSSERRRGLMVHWDGGLEAGDLGARIESARELLSLREPRKRAPKPPGPGQNPP
jgi:excinuclease UvrABC nuclease subunit